MERRKVRLVAYSNDALALAAANFNFPVYTWKTCSQVTQSITRLLKKQTWQVKVRNIRELTSLNPEKVYTSIPERLSGLPRGYTLKIQFARCLFEDETQLHFLDFHRDTIHRSYFTERGHQNYALQRIEQIWEACKQYYSDVPELQPQRFRPSILTLEAVDGDEELAGNLDFLISIRSRLWLEKNPISKAMYEIV